MPTDFWFDSAATPDISPAVAAEWDVVTHLTRRTLNIVKGSSAREDTATLLQEPNTMTTSNNDLLQGQHISPELAAQTISGTFKCYLQCRQSNAAANWRSQIILRVVSHDGTTVRGTLYAGDLSTLTGDPSGEWNSSTSVEVSRSFPFGGATALSSLAISDRDRIVVETGARQHNTQSTIRNGAIVYGEPATGDLPENETENATNLAGWIQFSGTIGLYVPSTARIGTRLMMIG